MANRNSKRETWLVEKQQDDRIALKAHDGVHYLCAEADGTLVVNRTAVGGWEQFTVVPTGWF